MTLLQTPTAGLSDLTLVELMVFLNQACEEKEVLMRMVQVDDVKLSRSSSSRGAMSVICSE